MENVMVARTLSLAALVSLASMAAAQQVPVGEYAERRETLLSRIDSGVVLAFGGVEPVVYWPGFYQRPSFQYLTGFSETDAVLLMVKRGGATRTTLFVPTRPPMMERWIGARTSVADIANKVPGAVGRDIADLPAVADSLARTGLSFHVIRDHQASDYVSEDTLTRGARFLTSLKSAHANLTVQVADSIVESMRAKKSAAEIGLLRKAVQISVKAHQEAMKAVGPGCGENEIEALLEGTFRRLGGDQPGYGSIVGSGPNATILHYMHGNRVMREGELLLIDAATSFEHYSADITRTMPVSGRFTQAQKDIYQLVRDAQETYVRQIKPGSRVSTSTDSARVLVANGLARLGLIESPDATYDGIPGTPCAPSGCFQRTLYVLHGYGGHGIGLEVHDPAQYYSGGVFKPGDVMSIEPGIYVDPEFMKKLPDTPRNRAMLAKIGPAIEKYKWIGVRIEDNYALTERGLEWMSAGAPREIAEIEALMARPDIELPGGGNCRTRS
jgi:Xaa-Pro aminopeptidase